MNSSRQTTTQLSTRRSFLKTSAMLAGVIAPSLIVRRAQAAHGHAIDFTQLKYDNEGLKHFCECLDITTGNTHTNVTPRRLQHWSVRRQGAKLLKGRYILRCFGRLRTPKSLEMFALSSNLLPTSQSKDNNFRISLIAMSDIPGADRVDPNYWNEANSVEFLEHVFKCLRGLDKYLDNDRFNVVTKFHKSDWRGYANIMNSIHILEGTNKPIEKYTIENKNGFVKHTITARNTI